MANDPNDVFVDGEGKIYTTDENGARHIYHTRESFARLSRLLALMDRLQAKLGYADRGEMFDKHFHGDRAAMFDAAYALEAESN